jgi:2-methylcitrate dehydratase
MTLNRDLTWETLNYLYRSSIAHQFARYALSLNYELLPKEVIHQAKRCLLDALGCAIGAYEAPGFPICEAVVKELGGVQEATVFGSGLQTSALNASLVNSFLVRFLDYNDLGGGGHNSDAISSILAVAEREKAKGQDFLISLVISYELGARVRDSIKGPSLEERGWSIDIRGGLNTPPALGRLMGLSEEQIANAIGVCTSHCLPLGILDADREEMTMMKNLRFGIVGYQAIMACLLAKRGFTGPVRIVEGDSGVRDVILKGEMDLERLTDFSGWRILKTGHKCLSANGSSLGYLLATLTLVKEHDLRPEDIALVRIRACLREYNHTTNLAKKYPRNAESADHSAFYMTAIAIKERRIGPDQFTPEKFMDPVVQELIEKVVVEPDLSMPVRCFQGISEITTKDGRHFQKHIETPHGLGEDPLSDQELEDKFRQMASKYMKEQQIQNIFKIIWNLEELDDIRKLTGMMIFRGDKR